MTMSADSPIAKEQPDFAATASFRRWGRVRGALRAARIAQGHGSLAEGGRVARHRERTDSLIFREDMHAQEIHHQRKAFAAWANAKLANAGRPEYVLNPEDLEQGLQNGVYLVNLAEVLTGQSAGRYHQYPSVRHHVVENLHKAFSMIEDHGCRVTVEPESISDPDQSEKNILGFLWACIKYYQLDGGQKRSGRSAKMELMQWVAEVVPQDVKVKTLNKTFRNGVVLCHLINALAPGSIDPYALDPKDAENNTKLAFKLAEERLGIPQILDVDDMDDDLSLMTYVSYFREFQRKKLEEEGRDAAMRSAFLGSRGRVSSLTPLEEVPEDEGRDLELNDLMDVWTPPAELDVADTLPENDHASSRTPRTPSSSKPGVDLERKLADAIEERDQALAAKESAELNVKQKDGIIHDKEAAIDEKNGIIAQKNAFLSEKEAALHEALTDMEEARAALAQGEADLEQEVSARRAAEAALETYKESVRADQDEREAIRKEVETHGAAKASAHADALKAEHAAAIARKTARTAEEAHAKTKAMLDAEADKRKDVERERAEVSERLAAAEDRLKVANDDREELQRLRDRYDAEHCELERARKQIEALVSRRGNDVGTQTEEKPQTPFRELEEERVTKPVSPDQNKLHTLEEQRRDAVVEAEEARQDLEELKAGTVRALAKSKEEASALREERNKLRRQLDDLGADSLDESARRAKAAEARAVAAEEEAAALRGAMHRSTGGTNAETLLELDRMAKELQEAREARNEAERELRREKAVRGGTVVRSMSRDRLSPHDGASLIAAEQAARGITRKRSSSALSVESTDGRRPTRADSASSLSGGGWAHACDMEAEVEMQRHQQEQLRQAVDDANAERDDAARALQELQDEVKRLQLARSAEQEEASRLKTQRHDFDEQFAVYEAKCVALQNEKLALARENEEAAARLAAARKECSELSEKNNRDLKDLRRARQDNAALQSKLAVMGGGGAEGEFLKKGLSKEHEANKALQHENDALRAALRDARDKADNTSDELAKVRTSTRAVKEEAELACARLDLATRRRDAALEEQEVLAARLRDAVASEKETKLQAEAIRARADSAEAQLRELRAEVRQLEGACAAALEDAEDAREKVEEDRARISSLVEAREKDRAAALDARQRVTALQRELDIAHHLYEEAAIGKKKYYEAGAELKKEYDHVLHDLDDAEVELTKLRELVSEQDAEHEHRDALVEEHVEVFQRLAAEVLANSSGGVVPVRRVQDLVDIFSDETRPSSPILDSSTPTVEDIHDALEDGLATVQLHHNETLAKLRALEGEHDELIMKFVNQSKQMDRLKDDMEDARKAQRRAEEQRAPTGGEAEEPRVDKELQEARREIEQGNTSRRYLQAELTTVRSEHTATRDKLYEAQAELEVARERQKVLDAELERALASVSAAHSTRRDDNAIKSVADATSKKLMVEAEKLRVANIRLKHELEDLQQQLDDAAKDVLAARRAAQDWEERASMLDALKKENASLRTEGTLMKRSLTRTESRNSISRQGSAQSMELILSDIGVQTDLPYWDAWNGDGRLVDHAQRVHASSSDAPAVRDAQVSQPQRMRALSDLYAILIRDAPAQETKWGPALAALEHGGRSSTSDENAAPSTKDVGTSMNTVPSRDGQDRTGTSVHDDPSRERVGRTETSLDAVPSRENARRVETSPDVVPSREIGGTSVDPIPSREIGGTSVDPVPSREVSASHPARGVDDDDDLAGQIRELWRGVHVAGGEISSLARPAEKALPATTAPSGEATFAVRHDGASPPVWREQGPDSGVSGNILRATEADLRAEGTSLRARSREADSALASLRARITGRETTPEVQQGPQASHTLLTSPPGRPVRRTPEAEGSMPPVRRTPEAEGSMPPVRRTPEAEGSMPPVRRTPEAEGGGTTQSDPVHSPAVSSNLPDPLIASALDAIRGNEDLLLKHRRSEMAHAPLRATLRSSAPAQARPVEDTPSYRPSLSPFNARERPSEPELVWEVETAEQRHATSISSRKPRPQDEHTLGSANRDDMHVRAPAPTRDDATSHHQSRTSHQRLARRSMDRSPPLRHPPWSPPGIAAPKQRSGSPPKRREKSPLPTRTPR